MSIALTSLLFALVHVPFYGWNALSVDFAAAVWLTGLRLSSGGVGAPAIAHVVADLVTWWL
jgi:membrane protease YdiL (CAAX protease family)